MDGGRSMKYLVAWGESFWKETEYRIQEVTTKLETDVRASLGAKVGLLDVGVSGERKLSTEEKAAICEHAQAIVDNVQIRQLFEVIDLLARDLLDDPQNRVYLVIDRLDETWVEDSVRFRLIRALIEAVRDFCVVKNAKIVVALRRDLLDRVIRETRDAGFQEEKYSTLYLPLSWTKKQLLEILDRRIDKLVREQYTTHTVTHTNLMPETIADLRLDDYLVSQTLMRPRDIILFFNCCIEACIEQGNGRPEFTKAILSAAEDRHSRARLRSLGDEWASNFPDLLDFVPVLRKRRRSFRLSEIPVQEFEDFCLDVSTRHKREDGPLCRKAFDVAEGLLPIKEFRDSLIHVFYRVGLVGIKTESFQGTAYSFAGQDMLPATDIEDTCVVSICQVFWRILGAVP